MILSLLLIGLIPVVFMSDIFPEIAQDSDEDESGEPAGNGHGGDMLDDLFGDDNDNDGTDGDSSEDPDDSALQPQTGTTPAPPGEPFDPDDVITPDDGDDAPPDGEPFDPNDVLQPDGSADPATLLEQLFASESDFIAGLEDPFQPLGETNDTALTDGDDTFLAPDDPDADSGSLTDWEGTPVLSADDPLQVVSGEAGNDSITLGKAAAYAFGGKGDDTLIAGQGAAALFGGAGNDSLVGHDESEGSWLDGGEGDDTLQGADTDEIMLGGAHAEAARPDDDTIDGAGGNDEIYGGYGADILSGGDGNDIVNHLGRTEEFTSAERHEFSWHIDNDADQLDGGDGNDTLIMDRADTATGGSGMDTFWVYFDQNSGTGAAQITDFQTGEDFLHVTLNPDAVSGTPEVEVAPSDNGQDGIVTINGTVIAVLQNAPNVTATDVYVSVAENIYG